MKRPAIIVAAAVVGVIALIVYFNTRVPAGVTPTNGDPATLAWISLAVAILSLATAVVGNAHQQVN